MGGFKGWRNFLCKHLAESRGTWIEEDTDRRNALSIKPRLKVKPAELGQSGGLTNPIDLSSRDEFRSSLPPSKASIWPRRIPNNQFAKSDFWLAPRLLSIFSTFPKFRQQITTPVQYLL